MMIVDGKRELEIVFKMESMEVIFVATDEEGELGSAGLFPTRQFYRTIRV